MKITRLSLIGVLLVGCGGGGSTAPDSGDVAESVSSSLLADNTVPADARFQQYQLRTFKLDPREYGLVGEHLYLKVYLSSGSVLYLGTIDPQSVFTLPLSLPNHVQTVRFDLFSDYEGEQGMTREVAI
ncbi:hypothetical protein VV869_20610 [Photobacterium sp. MCCC 1A19761]|uniref:hypothetical protein n=1 Tax=Photobacterium sp. MCCC 1A19761 TaxID=3115000 RepID=UPI00307E3A6A